MKIRFLCCVLAGFFACVVVKAQSSTALWDDSRVSEVYLTIAADSLDSIYTNIYATHYYQAEMVFDDGTVRDTISLVGLRLRGNTSRVSEKKSFKVSFNEYVPSRRYQGVKKLNFNGQHNDPTMVREKLFYEIWGKCGMPPRRTTFVRIYINQDYYGLYTCLEEIDKDWLTRAFGENDGNLYKCTYPADLVYQGSNPQIYKNIQSSTVTGGRAYDLQTNETLDDYSGLATLITQLDRNPDSQFAADIFQYLDVHAYLKALAIDVATGNWDDYAYNKNNYYLYDRLGTGQFEFITYDTDNTFGVDWVNRDWATRDCRDWLTHSEARPLASKLLDVPAFRSYYYGVLDSITRCVTHPDSVFPRLDSLQALITSAALADTFRSLDWGYGVGEFFLGYTGTVDGHTPYGIKPFLQARYANTLAQLPPVGWPPSVDLAEGFEVFPNPVSGDCDVTLRAKSPLKSELRVKVVDVMGRCVLEEVWPAYMGFIRLELGDFEEGKYYILLKGRDVNGALGFVRF